MVHLNAIVISGKEVLPLVEGGKGISVSNGESSGAWASACGVGTFSAVNADSYDEKGALIPVVYKGKTRRERHEELINYAIQGGITQGKIAHERSNGRGCLHMNVLWEMGAVEPILNGILSKIAPLVHGVTCGAGMPFKLAQICASYGLFYYPIVSSARAFRILWKRSYHKFDSFLGGVVYEDPWLAGGHNGLSNSEDPKVPQYPMPRVLELRRAMREVGLGQVPIFMAGGVWWLSEWADWVQNEDLGPIAFQFGTRPLLTQESPISTAWKQKLLTLKQGDVQLNRFSPTGFYSSAVRNDFLRDLEERSIRQIPYQSTSDDLFTHPLPQPRNRVLYVQGADVEKANAWIAKGYARLLKTPDNTIIFVTEENAQTILKDQVECMGCLSACRFSNWVQNEEGASQKRTDPRSYCIQKTLQEISHSERVNDQLMFAGHQAYRFATDPFYKEGIIPTVQELVSRIQTGY